MFLADHFQGGSEGIGVRGFGLRTTTQPLGGDGAGFAKNQDSRFIRHGDAALGVKCGLPAK
jgi:hypothetical protein